MLILSFFAPILANGHGVVCTSTNSSVTNHLRLRIPLLRVATWDLPFFIPESPDICQCLTQSQLGSFPLVF